MADDPNRDLLPVKECGPCKGPFRKMSKSDITDDHHNETLQVYYTDRSMTPKPNTPNKQELENCPHSLSNETQSLENRHRLVCDETLQLRQLCGAQANKIERLASKLVSIVNERNRTSQTVNKHSDRRSQKDENLHCRIIGLERHNLGLQDQIVVLKTQLATHSRLHNSVHCSKQASKSPSSHRSRSTAKHGPCSDAGSDHQDEDNGTLVLPQSEAQLQDEVHMLIQELEAAQVQALARIHELETELDVNRATEQRLHTAENIELIRLKRDVRHQSAKNQALAAQAEAVENGAAATQKALDEVLAQNNLLQKELQEERDKNADMRQDLAGVDLVEQIVTGLHGQIRDLVRENDTLKKYKNTMVKLISSGQLQTVESPAHSPALSPAHSGVEVISPDQVEETSASGGRAVKFVSPRTSEDESDDVKEVPVVENVALPPDRIPTLQQSLNVLQPPSDNKPEIIPKSDDNSIAHQLQVAELEAELEKCKELLRVQLQLNKGTKSEADNLTKRMRDLEAETLALRQGQTVAQYHQKPSWMSLDTSEGLFEIHVVGLQLTADGRDVIPENQKVFVSWSFFEQSQAQTMPKPSNLAEFKSSVVYKVNVNNELLEYISKDNCVMDLHVSKPGDSSVAAQGTLGFSELLQFPQNKLQATVPLRCADPHDPTKELTLGHLQCWYRLGCDVKLINEYVSRTFVQKKADIVHISIQEPITSVPISVPQSIQEPVSLVPDSVPVAIQESVTSVPSDTLSVDPFLPPAVPEVSDGTITLDLKRSSQSDESNLLPAVESSTDNRTTLQQMSQPNYPSAPEIDSFAEVEMESPVMTDWDQVDTRSKEAEIADIPESSVNKISGDSKNLGDNPSRLSIGELPGPTIYDVPVITKRIWLKPDDDGHGRVRHSSKPDIYRLIASDVSLPSAQETRHIYRTESEREMEKDIELGRTRLKSTDSEISNRTELQMMELMDANDWDHYARKSSLKKTSPSNKSLTDPPLPANRRILSNLSADQNSNLLNTASSDDLVNNMDTLTVKIDCLTVNYDNDFIQNSKIAQIYVEYKFLGQSGPKLETRSIPLVSGDPLVFNYKHRFRYDNRNEQKILLSMLNSESWHQEIVQFIVVSEPQPEEGKMKDCEEIGYADLNMKTQLEMQEDVVSRDLSVYSGDGFKEYIGTLTVSVTGIGKCKETLNKAQEEEE